MKKIGIIGGIGWPSTVEYYRIICEASQLYHRDKYFLGPVPMPEISIESLNMHFTVNHRGSSERDSWSTWDGYFQLALNRLEKSGAEVIVIASATPHTRLKEISKGTNVPIISLYESLGMHCKANKITRVLVFGTMPTMTSDAIKVGLERFAINAIYPRTDQQKTKVSSVIAQLYQNKTNGTASEIDGIVRECVPASELDSTAVLLGCTELPLAFGSMANSSSFEYQDIHYLNSSVIHALSAFQACL